MTDKVSVVHNGIIENFRELRDALRAEGAEFSSETDTEVVAHLITYGDEQGRWSDRRDRPRAATAARCVRARDHLCGPRRSDDRRARREPAGGRSRRRRDVPRLGRDRAGAVHEPDHLSRGGRLGDPAPRRRRDPRPRGQDGSSGRSITSSASGFLVDKGNHRHFMLKEIHEQPEVISHTLTNYIDMAAGKVRFPDLGIDLAKIPRVTISACGTAYLRRPRRQILDRALCARAGRDRCRVGDALSRGADAGRRTWRCSCRSRARRRTRWRRCATARPQGQRIVSVVNVRTSTIARESDVVLPTLAGPEIGVASTKAFTCQLATLACLRAGDRARARHRSRRRRSASSCRR